MTYINPNSGMQGRIGVAGDRTPGATGHTVVQSAHARPIPTFKRQCGMATLAISLILLIAVTLITFNVAKVGSVEQRISANDVRTLTAHETAQAAVEQAIAYLNANLPKINSTGTGGWRNVASTPSWTPCTTSETALPCGDGQTNKYGNTWLRYTAPNQINLPGNPYTTTVHYLTESVGGAVDDQPRMIILASVIPNSDPLAGSAVIQQVVKYFSLVTAPPSPLAALGKVELKGNISVHGNPSPAASFYPPLTADKPLSVWSRDNVDVDGSAQTCVPGSNCSGANKLTDKNTNGGDIAGNDADFPTDPFDYVFGVPNSEADTIKSQSTVLADCSGLSGASSGLFWVTGDCAIGANVGSADAPAIIVVEGDFRMNSNNVFYGLIYLKGGGNVTLNGGPTLWGGLVSDHDIDLGSGNYTSRYLDLSGIPPNSTGGFAKVPGGWLDTYQKPVS